MLSFQADDASVAVLRLAALAIVVTSAEMMTAGGLYSDGGLLSWRVGRLQHGWLVRPLPGRLATLLFSYPNVRMLMFARMVLGLAMLTNPWVIGGTWAVPLVAGLTLLLLARSPYGLDGADQMVACIVVGYSLLQGLPPESAGAGQAAFLFFIGAQACLAYVAAGMAKVIAPGWRDGSSITFIFSTEIYGMRGLGALFRRHPRLAMCASWGVFIGECAFPLVLVLPAPAAVVMLGAAACFHLLTAVIMGLNDFLLAFLAAYPAVWYLRLFVQSLIG